MDNYMYYSNICIICIRSMTCILLCQMWDNDFYFIFETIIYVLHVHHHFYHMYCNTTCICVYNSIIMYYMHDILITYIIGIRTLSAHVTVHPSCSLC